MGTVKNLTKRKAARAYTRNGDQRRKTSQQIEGNGLKIIIPYPISAASSSARLRYHNVYRFPIGTGCGLIKAKDLLKPVK